MSTEEPDYRSERVPHENLTHLADEIAALARSTPGISERLRGVDLIVHLSTEGPGGRSGLGYRGLAEVTEDGHGIVARKLARTLAYLLENSQPARDAVARMMGATSLRPKRKR